MRMRRAVMKKYLRCSQCDAVMPIYRRKSSNRPNGHIKDMWCYKCKRVTKHVEYKEEQAAITAPSSVPYLVSYNFLDVGLEGDIIEKRRALVQLGIADSIGKIEEILRHEVGDVEIRGVIKYG